MLVFGCWKQSSCNWKEEKEVVLAADKNPLGLFGEFN
jgi:hypothetical protein